MSIDKIVGGVSERWLVTGGAGYLGSHVCELLISRGTPVVVLDNLSSGKREYIQKLEERGLELAVADIKNRSAVRAVFERYRPTHVVHLAALHFIPACVANPAETVSINVHGTTFVLEAARDYGAMKVFFASTGDVYKPADVPHREDHATEPFNIYGVSKLTGEQLVRVESHARPQAAFFVGRLFNLYGPRETNPHFIPEILKQLKENPDAPLRLGNLFPKRDLVPVEDAACAIMAALDRVPAGLTIANVATGTAHSMQEVVDSVVSLLGGRARIEIDPAKVRPSERNCLQADVSKLRAYLGWTPRANVTERLEELLVYEGMKPTKVADKAA